MYWLIFKTFRAISHTQVVAEPSLSLIIKQMVETFKHLPRPVVDCVGSAVQTDSTHQILQKNRMGKHVLNDSCG